MDTLTTRKSIISKVMFALMLLVFISGATGWMVKAEDGGGEESEILSKTQILSTRFDEQERLRVIVQLNVPGQTKQAELMTPAIHTTQNELMSAMKAYNIRLIHEYDYIPFMAMEVDRAAFEGLLNSPLVVGVEEDILMKPMLAESVPLINADDVWAAGYTGAGQVVAVLDTGVDKNHPALAGKVVSEACYSTNNIDYSSTSLCPGGVPQSISPDSALPYINNCPSGECDHGTHVAGIVAANTTTVKGVAKGSNLLAIQVFSRIDSSYYCGTEGTPCVLSFSSDQIKGLERVYSLRSEFPIAAVNLSLGGDKFTNTCDAVGVNISYKSAVDLLRSVGIVTIAASGNNGYIDGISSPACISTVVSVGATTDADTVASFSNSASILDLLAPGTYIYSTIPYNQYAIYSGTSMATPHVAGAWALIRSAIPDVSIDTILNALKTTGVLITDYRNGIQKPRIDVSAALQSILTPQPTIPQDISASDGSYLDKVTITWSPSENTDDYQIYRNISNDSTGATQLANSHPSSSYDDTSAIPGTMYYYWVKACNDYYCSDLSTSDSGWRAADVLTAPTGVLATDGIYNDKVNITWNGVGGADYFQIYRNIVNSTIDSTLLADSITLWTFDDLSAERGTEYYYWLKACKTQGQVCSDYSMYDIGYLKEDFNIFLPLMNNNYADIDPILNGDFELGRDGSWTENSSNGYVLILEENDLPIYPKSGDWAVWLGDDIDVYGEISRLSQDVSIYSSSPYLHFWFEIFSDDLCSIDYDVFRVKINGGIIFSEELCNANNTTGWTEKVINLSAFSGSSVTIMFEVITDDVLFSSFFLDDVSMSSVSTTSAVIGDEILVLGDVTRSK